MTIEIDILRYVGIYEEPSGSYQVDHSGTPADFLALPYMEGSLQAQGGRAQLDPMAGKMRLDGHSKKVLGVRSCTLNVGVTLHSHGLDLDGDVAAPTVANWAMLRVLKAIMGGVAATTNPGAQTQVQAGGTTTTAVEVTASHGARFAPGTLIGAVVNGTIEWREVDSVATDTVSVKEAFSATPTTGSAVRGGVTVYPTEDPQTSLQALIEGREGHDGAVYRGLQGGFSLQLPAGELGQVQFALQGASWARLGSSSATVPTHAQFSPMALAPLIVSVPTIGSTTRTVVEAQAVTIEPQLTYAPQRSGRATETIARMRRQPVRPLVRGSFLVPYEDDTWFTARDTRADRALFVQAGQLAGSTCLISCPTIQITDVQPAVLETGIAGQLVSFEGRHDEEIGSTGENSYAAFRMHFG